MKKRVLSVLLAIVMVVGMFPVTAGALPAPHTHPVCGKTHTDIGDHTGTCEAVEWTAWNGTTDITYTDGTANVYLSQDAERSSTLQIDGTNTLSLCLNGHTLTYTGDGAGSVIKLLNSGRLNICDCSQDVLHYGQWDNNKTVYTISDAAPEGEYDVLSGGIITGGSGCGVSVGSAKKTNPPVINMYGGNIAGNYNGADANTGGGGGVCLLSTKMNLYGGGIIGNGRATSYYCHGGGIGTSGSSILTMYGGKVENNVTTVTGGNSYGGGGIYIAPGSSFYMYDGSISHNYSAGNGGGIAVWGHNYSDGSSHVELRGGEISNNVATGSGGGISLKGKVNNYTLTVSMSGGTISGTGRYLKEKNPDVKIVGVEPAASPLLTRGQAGPHGLQGIGANFVPKNYDASLVDEIIPITETEAYNAARLLARTEGVLVGITSGAALRAADMLAQRPENHGKTIVALLPDDGGRYLSTDLWKED